MAVRVVDLLEAVQVQSEYGQGVPLALRACHFGGQALFREPPVIQTSQRINHGEIAEKVGMALLLGELAAKPLDENCLRNRIDVKSTTRTIKPKTTSAILILIFKIVSVPRHTAGD